MEYFKLEQIPLFKNDIHKKYDDKSPGAKFYYDTRNKLKYLGETLAKKFNVELKNNYREKPNKMAGKGKGFVLKNYILTGFLFKKYKLGKEIFIKVSFHGFDSVPEFGLDIDINFKDADNRFRKDREKIQADTIWRLPVDAIFPSTWEDLIKVTAPKFKELLDYLDDFLSSELNPSENNETLKEVSLNQILYGPPGTGKTYHTINRAIEIINPNFDFNQDRKIIKKEFDQLIDSGQIVFTTFHQSMSYEDFVEGIKPETTSDNKIVYNITPGILKSFVDDIVYAEEPEDSLSEIFEDIYDIYKNDLSEKSEIELETPIKKKKFKVFLNSAGSSVAKPNTEVGTEMVITKEMLKDYIINGVIRDWKPYTVAISKHLKKNFANGSFPDLKDNTNNIYQQVGKVNSTIWLQLERDTYSKKSKAFASPKTIKLDFFAPSKSKQKALKDLNEGDVYSTNSGTIVCLNKVVGSNEYWVLDHSNDTKFEKWHKCKIQINEPNKEVDIVGKAEFNLEFNGSNPSVSSEKKYVLIIDEINRGNVSSIFGELITLIEEDKRIGADEELKVVLPYSKDKESMFGVPSNLHIIGTMNTADRSVEALDTALRRRFVFKEMLPQPELLSPSAMYCRLLWKYHDVEWEEEKFKEPETQLFDFLGADEELRTNLEERKKIWGNMKNEKDLENISYFDEYSFSGYNLQEILETINKRIEVLLDKDHLIGHSYFINITTESDLKLAFSKQIIPLLQEYFFGDYGKIALVLGNGFCKAKKIDNASDIFAKVDDYDTGAFDGKTIYSLQGVGSEKFDIKSAIEILLENSLSDDEVS